VAVYIEQLEVAVAIIWKFSKLQLKGHNVMRSFQVRLGLVTPFALRNILYDITWPKLVYYIKKARLDEDN